MRGSRGGLSVPAVMDLYERQRTVLIGGQGELERLKKEEGVLIVVYSIQRLRFHEVPVQPREEIEVSSGFVVQNDMFYCVHQSVTHVASGRTIAEGHLKLVFVKDGKVGKAPESTLRNLERHGPVTL